MKTITKLLAVPALLVCIMMVTSCTKDQVTPGILDTDFGADEISMKQPDPGTYTIFKFIDTGGDETAQFNGYTFQFQATGALIATTGTGQVFNGSWDLNSAETVMTINISGNAALNDLDDDDWSVVRITNKTIKIKANGPDVVVWKKI
ncbi:MAG: hypothetical protein ABIO46_06880 [Chitinophagales bacterium]